MNTLTKDKEDARKGAFKQGISAEDARKKRVDLTNQIRKEKKENRIAKKRQQLTADQPLLLQQDVLDKLAAASEQIQSDSNEKRLLGTKQIRQLLSVEVNPPIDEVISSGVVPMLISFLNNDTSDLQFEAAWSLTNIASGSSKQTQYIIQLGAIHAFAHLLVSPAMQVRDQSIWALGNIAGDSFQCRDAVLSENTLGPILTQIQDPAIPPTMRKNATWTLSNLCRGKPPPPFALISQSIPILAQLITCDDKEILTDACWALSYLSDGTNDMIQTVMSHNVTKRLVELLSNPNPTVITPALRTVGNFVTGLDEQTQAVIDCGVVPQLMCLLSHPKSTIIKETCWTLSNIAAGSPQQIQSLFNGEVMPLVISLLGAPYDIKREAAWIIANATCSGQIANVEYLVQKGVIRGLYSLLDIPDVEIKEVALTGLTNILRVGNELFKRDHLEGNPYTEAIMAIDGGDLLANLQDHPHVTIQKKVQKILKDYFPLEDEEDASSIPTAPAMNDSQTTHTFGLQNVPGNNLFQNF